MRPTFDENAVISDYVYCIKTYRNRNGKPWMCFNNYEKEACIILGIEYELYQPTHDRWKRIV